METSRQQTSVSLPENSDILGACMKLYDLAWGPWTRRVTVYLKEKGVSDIEIVSLEYGDEKSPALLKKNPLGFLPFLELDEGSVLTDSIAIMKYLEELYPSPSFVGRSAEERCRMEGYLLAVNELFIRALPVYANRIPQFARVLEQSEHVASWLEPFYKQTVSVLEELADEKGPFLMGERITLVDCALYPMYHHNMANYGIETFGEDCVKLQRWAKMFSKRDSAPCPLRNDGLLEEGDPPPRADGKKYWWQKD